MKQILEWTVLLALLLGVALGYLRLVEDKGYALKTGAPAPVFSLPTLGGERQGLASYRGKVVLLNFWATWCPPCVAEMPSLERLHRTLGGSGLAVVTVSTDEDEAELRRFVAQHGLTLPVLRDPGGRVASDAYRTTGYPETFVIDRAGRLLQHTVGPAEWDTAQALAYFNGLLAASAAAPGAGHASPGEARATHGAS